MPHHLMRLWVDADACPNVIKEILFRAAERTQRSLTLVANQWVRIPPSPHIRMVQVAGGFDVADNYIAEHVQPGDLVITADIPLAAAVIAKDAHALNPRGDLYTKDNIQQRLALRDFMESLRSTGFNTGGPSAFSQSDQRVFANALDRFLAHSA